MWLAIKHWQHSTHSFPPFLVPFENSIPQIVLLSEQALRGVLHLPFGLTNNFWMLCFQRPFFQINQVSQFLALCRVAAVRKVSLYMNLLSLFFTFSCSLRLDATQLFGKQRKTETGLCSVSGAASAIICHEQAKPSLLFSIVGCWIPKNRILRFIKSFYCVV